MTIGRIARLLAIAAVIALSACGAAAAWLIAWDRNLPAVATTLVIQSGERVSDIGAQLRDAGIVRSELAFTLFVRAAKGGADIQAAEYTFAPHQSMQQVLATLRAGGRAPSVWLTIPEGFTAAQIGALLQRRGIASAASFDAVVHHTSLSFGSATSVGLEGYLFPDTYQLSPRSPAADAAAKLTGQFLRELPPDYRLAARRLKLTVPQIVTLASLIEREAKVDDERALMAGVYINRLRLGMPLQVDATIEYALPSHKTSLSFADLQIDSPYNTYLHTGLPPTPIANPGRASLWAAFHPAKTEFLYYVYKGGGRHEFSRTLHDQQAAERRYLR